jgi:putative transposase
VEVKAPRVNDRRVDENGERRRFKSVVLPTHAPLTAKVSPRSCLCSILDGLSSPNLTDKLKCR